MLAEDDHALMKTAFEERLRTLTAEDVGARFDRLFERMPDGAVRNRTAVFDGTRQTCLFVPRDVSVDDSMRRRILAAHDVTNQYGPAFLVRFRDTFFTLPEGVVLVYWPDRPHYCQEAEPDLHPTSMEYFGTSTPQNNPARRTAWSGVYYEEVTGKWMATATTPVDQEGRHIASISHDVMIEDLLARTISDSLPDAYNVIFRDDGQFIAYPGMHLEHTTEQPVATKQQVHLRRLAERVMAHPSEQQLVELPEDSEYVAVARMHGTRWNFATVLPSEVVSRPAIQAARVVLLLGVLSLLFELAIVSWVLRTQITRPLAAFTQATNRVAAGDFKVEFNTVRDDELGQLAHDFRLMADELQRREAQLRATNEGLEQRVEERTRELKQVHEELVQTARRTGMAEIATNVLHNVGNVLNSVYTSAQIAKERLQEMRLEHVGRVAHTVQDHQADVATFLGQDERGRHLMPFLSKLGQNLLEEREAVISLLEDVGRYTEHIGEIIKVQQNYARTPRIHEPVSLENLVEDALRINAAGLVRHQVKVERRLAPLPPVLTDKHKALMILVNLVSNAKYAMDTVPQEERRLQVTLERYSPDGVRIVIHDNGMGIAPEMLNRIFQYGFTTREAGHGFGLHSSALAAQELGGALTVQSEGLGRGATFTLELPYLPAQDEPT
jgi:two-component system, NtrC family, sensor kinase